VETHLFSSNAHVNTSEHGGLRNRLSNPHGNKNPVAKAESVMKLSVLAPHYMLITNSENVISFYHNISPLNEANFSSNFSLKLTIMAPKVFL